MCQRRLEAYGRWLWEKYRKVLEAVATKLMNMLFLRPNFALFCFLINEIILLVSFYSRTDWWDLCEISLQPCVTDLKENTQVAYNIM